MEQENRNGRGIGAAALFLSGLSVGVAAGLLLAPDSGKETRRKVSQWLKEKREKGRDELLARKEQVNAALEAGRRAYKDAEKKFVGV